MSTYPFTYPLYILQVIQGLLQAHESVIVSKDNVAQLFAHEATRVFHDRLICPEDRDVFFQFLSDNLHDHFKVNWNLFGFCLKDVSEANLMLPPLLWRNP